MKHPPNTLVGRAPWAWLLVTICHCSLLASCDTGQMIAVKKTEAPCVMLGAPSTDGECCSESSVDGKCTALEFCKSVGSLCNVPADCCSGYCVNSTCTASPGWPPCSVEGEHCERNGQCCSGACASSTMVDPNFPALPHCQPLDGCKPVGERCTLSKECCSDRCVVEPTSGVSRCQLSCNAPDVPCQTNEDCCSQICNAFGRCDRGTLAFLQPGEVCGSMGLRCDVADPATATRETDCVETKEHVYRCRNFDTARQFEWAGAPCETSSECCAPTSTTCAWFCLPPTTGTQTGPECTQSCVPVDGSCLAAADCCTDSGPATCHLGRCHLTGLACAQLGQACTSSGDCCSRDCATTSGPFSGAHCVVPQR